jgi:long-chain acyl-CoA synthetase
LGRGLRATTKEVGSERDPRGAERRSCTARARLWWVGDVELTPAGSAANVGVSNLAELVSRQAERSPDVIAVVQPGAQRRTLTWSELDSQINAVASGLAAHGLVAGHRIGLLGPNSVEFVVAYFAALRCGYVVVPMNPQSTPHEIRAMLLDTGARVLLGTAEVELEGLHQVPLTVGGLGMLARQATAEVSSPADPEALAVLLYTAGTSGRPKAAMLSHRALISHVEHVAPLGIVSSSTTVLGILPMFHVYGLNAVLGSWAMGGARLVIMDGFGDDFFDVVRAEGVSNLPLSPALIARILDHDQVGAGLGAVTSVVSGAAPLGDEVREAFAERTGLRVEQGYGLTEAGPGISATLAGSVLGHGHVGRALPGVEIRIGDGSEPGEPGEIWVRGGNLFSGYWPDGQGGPDTDGWFPTGDIGYLLGDELFLVDRARELIIVNGFNVYPAEVEDAIRDLAGVESVAVVGRPSHRTGEEVVAFVTSASLTAEQIDEHCATRLAKFKRPAVIRLVDELPRGATGKIQKGILRHALLDGAGIGA